MKLTKHPRAIPRLWPLGTYRVDLYLNDKLDRSLDFSVQ